MRTGRRGGLLRVLSMVLLALPSAVGGQEAAVSSLFGRSGVHELPEAAGFSVAVSLPMHGAWKVVVNLDRRRGDGPDRRGVACVYEEMPATCRREDITSRTTLDGISVLAVRQWWPSRALKLGGGMGIAVGRTRLNAFGTSGREAQVMNPNTAHPGAAAHLEASWSPVPTIPVRLRLALQRRVLYMAGCDAQKERYEAFCGTYAFDDLTLGFAWLFPL